MWSGCPTDDLWSVWETRVLLFVPCSGVSVPPGYKPWNLTAAGLQHFQEQLAVSHIILPTIICSVLLRGSKTIHWFLLILSLPSASDPTLLGCHCPVAFRSRISLLMQPSAIFQEAFPQIPPFYCLAALPSPALHLCVLESPLHAEELLQAGSKLCQWTHWGNFPM